MVEFRRMYLNRIEATRNNRKVPSSMDIAVNVPNLTRVAEGIEAEYTFTATYKPGVGHLSMRGTLIMVDSRKNLDSMMSRWEKSRTVEENIVRQISSLITYVSSVNGVLISKAMNLTPPIMPPDIRFEGAPKVKQKEPNKQEKTPPSRSSKKSSPKKSKEKKSSSGKKKGNAKKKTPSSGKAKKTK